MTRDSKHVLIPLQTLAVATFFVFTLFMWEGKKDFDLRDEGYLWYGVQRVMLGEVPLRDFMAYDPGRYYWSAALMSLRGSNSIMTLRGVEAIVQTIGLFVALSLIVRNVKTANPSYLLLSAMTLVVWMYPRNKVFDVSLSILLIGVLAFLVQNPTSSRYFLAGLCLGLIATFGRNHGIYGVVGSIGVMVWLHPKTREGPGLIKGFALWAAGVAAGFTPLLVMALMVPGFAVAFWESIRFSKATILPLPVPWSWRLNLTSVPLGGAITRFLVSLFFIAIVAFAVLSIIWVIRQKLQDKQVSPVLVAASFLALPYAHYAYSRADIEHLAMGIFPLLVGCLVFLARLPTKIKWPLALILCAASVKAMNHRHPGWECYVSKQCVSVDISGDKLLVSPSTARHIQLLRTLAERYAPYQQSFIVTPLWPGAYSVLERKSPMWEIYALFPRSKIFQQAEIERIKAARPSFALVIDQALDGHERLRFQNTHPLINQYIIDHFEKIPEASAPGYGVYKAKGDMQFNSLAEEPPAKR
jgi:hypothetical protein